MAVTLRVLGVASAFPIVVSWHCNGNTCWPWRGFDCDGDGDCLAHSSMRNVGAVKCGNANCPWSDWLGTDDCCVKVSAGCSGRNCYPYWGSFDCDSDGDCIAFPSMKDIGATICGNDNCPWSGSDDCCVKVPFDCGCADGACFPHKHFDCDSDEDCSGNSRMAALGAMTCGNANCAWDDFLGKDDCCIRTACTGEDFEHPTETFMDVESPMEPFRVVADLETVHIKVTKLSLLTGPTDGFGDIFGLNKHDEVKFTAQCPSGGGASSPRQDYAACDTRTNILKLECSVNSLSDSEGVWMTVEEEDTSRNDIKRELLDSEALLGMPVGSTTRVRFFLNNEQNVFDSALLGLADIGFFEFCLSDVLSLVPGGQAVSAAVKAAKAAKLSAKAVQRLGKVAKKVRQGVKKIDRVERQMGKANYEAAKEKMDAAQDVLIMAGEFADAHGGNVFDPSQFPSAPDWPSMETMLDAFDVIPCADLAQGNIYRYTVYEAEIKVDDDSSMGYSEYRSGLEDHGDDSNCLPADVPSDFDCHIDQNILGERTCYNCPIKHVSSVTLCAEKCRQQPGCGAFVHNKYNDCWLKSDYNVMVPDNTVHQTVSCVKKGGRRLADANPPDLHV